MRNQKAAVRRAIGDEEEERVVLVAQPASCGFAERGVEPDRPVLRGGGYEGVA